MNEEIPQTKVCTKCKTEKYLSLFNKHKRQKDGLQSQCKDCCSEARNIYHKTHKDKEREYLAKWRLNNKEKWNSYKFNYYDKYLEYQREYNKLFRQTELGKAYAINKAHKRRSYTKEGDVTTTQLVNLQKNSTHCYWCNTEVINTKVHIDHYIPLSKGGMHTISNLVISCPSCNMSKGAKDPIEFANSIGRLF